jgi:hypothetical protein
MTQNMYVVGTLLKEGTIHSGTTVSLSHGDIVGMLPVFATREAAEQFAPDNKEIFTIASVSPTQ